MLKVQPAILLVCLIFLSGCDDDDTGPDIRSLVLTLSKNKIVADGVDFSKVKVVNQSGADIMEYIDIYLDDKILDGDKIVSSTPSISTVCAKYNDLRSNEEVLEIVEDRNLRFLKNVLLEQYTGTWCGWCPRAVSQINNLEKTDDDIVHVAYHLSDEFVYQYNMTLFQSFGFTGIPTVHADRSEVWQGEGSVISSMHAPSRIGLSIEVSGNTGEIMTDISVKFGYYFTNTLLLSVFLLHDSLVANQANYYNTDPSSVWYNAGNPMTDFVHRNVMMRAGTDMLGDVIPSSSVELGGTYNKRVTFRSFTVNDIRKMFVIAFVAAGSGTNKGEVLNCIKAKVGQKAEFVYDDD